MDPGTIHEGTMYIVKLIQVENSLGVVFPNELLARLNLQEGDKLCLTDSPDGVRITKHSPEFEEQMRLGREVMKQHRGVLRELAKK
jgi:putative addiction module antidote